MSRPPSLWASTRPDEQDGAPPKVARMRSIEEARRKADAAARAELREAARRGTVRRRRIAGAAAAAVVLLGGGLVAGQAFDGESPLPEASAPLPAKGGSGVVGRVYSAAGPGVVSVQADRAGGQASGTGFLIDREGTILTNAHVVGPAGSADVSFGDSGKRIDAEVLGTDASSDLAVLRVDPDETGNVRPLALGDSDDVRVGDTAVAIGHPFGLDRTATAGIVSGVGREIQAPNGFQIDKVIQTDAPINPGNSGGPLLDARGRVIGVNSQIATAGAQGNVGIGFAVPSNTVRAVVPRLRRGQRVVRPFLGLTTSAGPQPGAVVQQAAPDGPAAEAGIRAGDRVVSVDGKPVREPDDVSQAIERKRPGKSVEVEVVRDGARRSFDVRLRERPEGGP